MAFFTTLVSALAAALTPPADPALTAQPEPTQLMQDQLSQPHKPPPIARRRVDGDKSPSDPALTVVQVGGAVAGRTPSTEQLGPSGRPSERPIQLTNAPRIASAPPALSTPAEGRTAAVAPVHGHDLCDVQGGRPLAPECADILDNRAQDFAQPAPQERSAEQILIESPPATDGAITDPADRRFSGAATDPATAQAASALQAASAASAADKAAPPLPAGITTILSGLGVSSPNGATTTVTSAPK